MILEVKAGDIMGVPQDIANLLAVAVRDVIWYKQNVKSFLNDCRIPQPFLGQAEKRLDDGEATIKVIHFVLDSLRISGDAGDLPQRQMLTKLVKWKDFHTIKPDRRQQAQESVKALRDAYDRFVAERKFEQEEAERRMHADRTTRREVKPLDHAKLHGFRDEFDCVWVISDPNERGNRFQDLLNRIFAYYSDKSQGDFRRDGEQIDGLFYFDNHWWYVEIRWKKEKANAGDISILRDRAKAAFGGDTKALFISFNGFSPDCLDSLTNRTEERVILMDGADLRVVLDCVIAFDVLIAEKQADIVQRRKPFVTASEIVRRRTKS